MFLIIVFVPPATQYWRQKVLEVANEHRDVTFAIAKEQEFEQQLKDLGLEDSGEEINVGCFDDKDRKYRMEPDEEFSEDSLREFVENFKEGMIKEHAFFSLMRAGLLGYSRAGMPENHVFGESGACQNSHSYLRNQAVANNPEKIQAWTGFEPVTSAIPVQCSHGNVSYQENWGLVMFRVHEMNMYSIPNRFTLLTDN